MSSGTFTDDTVNTWGHPVQIIDIKSIQGKDSKLEFKKQVLQDILRGHENTPLHVISIAGASKQGKSFLMTILVNLLARMEKGLDTWEDLIQTDQPFPGFDFENGIERTTVGFWTWSRCFILPRNDGSKIAVLLVDTQGVFDQFTDERDWATIVGLALLTSTTIIYNLMNNMLDNTLTILRSFLEFGTLMLNENYENDGERKQPFQKIMFLIRDWNVPNSCPFGLLGGQSFITEKLRISPGMKNSGRQVRELIKACFEEIDCFLLPHPGIKAIQNSYTGRLSELENEFLQNLITFTENLLLPDTMRTKMQGQELKGPTLISLFEKYSKAFNAIRLPEPKTLLVLATEAKCEALCERLTEIFKQQVNFQISECVYVEPSQLKLTFQEVYRKSIVLYKEKSVEVIRSEKIREKYFNYLNRELVAFFHFLTGENEKKEMELQESACNEGLTIFSQLMTEATSSAPLLPNQFETVRTAAEAAALAKLQSGLKDFPVLAQKFEEPLLTQLSEREKSFRNENEEKVLNTERAIATISSTLLENYANMMSMTQVSPGLGQDKLNRSHKLSEDIALNKFAEEVNKIPGMSANQAFRDRAIKQFKSEILDCLKLVAEEVAEEYEKLERNCEEFVEQSMDKFEGILKTFSSTMQIGSELDALISNHKSSLLQDLVKLYNIHPNGASFFLENAKTRIDAFILELKKEIQERNEIYEKQLTQILHKTRQQFGVEIETRLHKSQMKTTKEFRNASSSLKEKVLHDTKAELYKFADESLREKWLQEIKGKLSEDLETYMEEYQTRRENDLANFRVMVQAAVESHEAELHTFLQSCNEVHELEKFHNQRITEYKAGFLKLQDTDHPGMAKEVHLFQQRMQNLLTFNKSILEQKFDLLVQDVEKNVDKCFQFYQTAMNLRCTEYTQDQEYERIHADCKKQACLDFTSYEFSGISAKKRDFFHSELVQKIEQSFESLLAEVQKQRQKDAADIERLKVIGSKDFETACPLILQKSQCQEEASENLQDYFDQTMRSFEERFPKGAIRKLSTEVLAFRSHLRRIKGEATRKFRQQQNNAKNTTDKTIAEYKSQHLAEIKLHLFPSGKSVAVPDEDLQLANATISQKLKLEIENRPDLKANQKQEINANLAEVFNDNLAILGEENAYLLEQAETMFQVMLSTADEDVASLARNSKTREEFIRQLPNLKEELLCNMNGETEVCPKLFTKFQSRFSEWLENGPNRHPLPGQNEVEYLLESCKILYHQGMKEMTGDNNYLSKEALDECHQQACNRVEREKLTSQPEVVIIAIMTSLKCVFEQYVDANDMKKNELEGVAIGIDLGTTYSCAAVYRNGLIEMIPNENSTFITPSYVLYKDQEVVVGNTAKSQAVLYPGLVVFDSKRLIGRKFKDTRTQKDITLWPFKVVQDKIKKQRPVIQIGEETYYPEEVSAEILMKLKKDAEKYLNCKVKKAVITVPAYFSDAQKQATINAGRIADLKVLGVLSEPTSAAMAYSLSYTDEQAKNVFVYDLGGGTFDVSVLQMCKGKVEVMAVAGDNHLGGQDFDNAMLEHCLAEFKDKTGIDLMEGNQDIVDGRLRRIRHMCEQEKINLSVVSSVRVLIEGIVDSHVLDVEFTQDIFNTINQEDFERTISIVKMALKETKITAEEIDDVVLVGGSSRIPRIQELLHNVFPGRMFKTRLNPDEVVARGAALYSAIQNGRQAKGLGKIDFRDVAPLSLGIMTVGDVFSKIIKRNTPIPVIEKASYTTVNDNQTFMKIEVYEGEDSTATNNNLLGTFTMKGIPKKARGKEKVELSMCLNKEGILKVTAVVCSTGRKESIEVEAIQNNLSENEILEIIAKRKKN